MEEEVEDIENAVFVTWTVSVDQVTYIFEQNRAKPEQQTDLQSDFDPIITFLFLFFEEQINTEGSRYK